MKQNLPCWITIKIDGDKFYAFFDHTGRLAQIPTNYFTKKIHETIAVSYSEKTEPQYMSHFRRLAIELNTLNDMKGLPLDTQLTLIDRTNISNILKNFVKNGARSRSTLTGRETLLKSMLKWMTTAEAGRVRKNHPYEIDESYISKKTIAESGERGASDIVTQELVTLFLLGLKNECERCFFHFIHDSGERISEAIRTRYGDIPELNEHDDRKYFPITIRGSKGKAGNIKIRTGSITRPMLIRIKRYHASPFFRINIRKNFPGIPIEDCPAFLTVNGLKWTYSNCVSQFDAAVRRQNIPKWFDRHDLRHGKAYAILISSDTGETFFDRLLEVKRVLGHSGLDTTQKFYTNLPMTVIAEIERLAKGNLLWKLADQLVQNTFLGPANHLERRGHRPTNK